MYMYTFPIRIAHRCDVTTFCCLFVLLMMYVDRKLKLLINRIAIHLQNERVAIHRCNFGSSLK